MSIVNFEDYFPSGPVMVSAISGNGLGEDTYLTTKKWQFANDVSFTGSSFGPIVTVTPTGVADGQKINLALAILPSNGGRLLLKAGTYSFDTSADRIFITKSNVTLDAEPGVIFRASASLFPGGSNAQGQFGVIVIGRNQTSMISNITLRNMTIDCNNQLKTAALTIDGGSALQGQIGAQKVLIENVTVRNSGQNSGDPLTAGVFIASGTDNAVGNRGYVDRLTFRDCDFGFGQERAVYFQGTNITNILMSHCYIHDNNRDGVFITDYGTVPSSSDWTFDDCRFERNMILTSGSSQAHIRDNTQIGVYNLVFNKLYFGPTLNPTTDQDYCITPYWAANCRITNCIFDRVGVCVSLGASIAASYAKIFPINRLIFENNIVYQARSMWDPDSTVFGLFKNNIFYEIKNQRVFGSYSRHFPTIIEGNLIYDCHTDNSAFSANEYHKAAIQTAGDGFIIRNNYIIDDRKLTDPTNALTLSQVAGGALGARTYYVRYTWSNDVGETLGRTEQSISVSANNLLQTNVGFSFIPSGAKFMNVYVSTTSGSGWTLQASIANPTKTWIWLEPTSGLVAGAALPVSNTTDTKTKYGIYELAGGASGTQPNVYQNNHFVGVDTPISQDSGYTRVRSGNTWSSGGILYDLEKMAVGMGNATGAVTVTTLNGENQSFTMTGNVTFTLSGGDYIGQTLQLGLTQDGTGNRTATWPANFKKAGGTLTLSTAVSAKDVVNMRWDGTNWNELSRSLNVS